MTALQAKAENLQRLAYQVRASSADIEGIAKRLLDEPLDPKFNAKKTLGGVHANLVYQAGVVAEIMGGL